MVDKELIERYRKTLKPVVASWLFNINYEGMGEQDKEEFERDFDEILDLALIGLKHKAQLSHKDATIVAKSKRTFVELLVHYPHPDVCTYPEHKGKPYYSIKYIEDGECFVGFGTYNPEVLSQYLRDYFMPLAQPHLITEIQNGIKVTDADDAYSCGMRNGMRWCMSLIDGKEPLYENCPPAQPEQRWIPCSKQLPRQGQEVICQCRANIIKVLKLDAYGDWYQDADHCYMGGFVIAWMPLPEPYKEGGADVR